MSESDNLIKEPKYITYIDYLILALSTFFSVAIASFDAFHPETNDHVSFFDVKKIIQEAFELNLLGIITAEMVRIIYHLRLLKRSMDLNTETNELVKTQFHLINHFSDKLVRILSHKNPVVRRIVPHSMNNFFNTIQVEEHHIAFGSDYFGAEVYSSFLSRICELQVNDQSRSRMKIRAAHSASIEIWKKQEGLYTIQKRYSNHDGVLYRIIIRNADSKETHEEYNEVIRRMKNSGVRVFFVDYSSIRPGEIHDYLIFREGAYKFVMRWQWEYRSGSASFGAIKGCDLYMDGKHYREHSSQWNDLVDILVNCDNRTAPQHLQYLHHKPTVDEIKDMRIIV